MLGAACGLRLGEIQAIKLANIKSDTLMISLSWGKIDGMKDTKTGKSRVVPLPAIIKDELLKLSKLNPHVSRGYLIYGTLPDAPLDCRAIERGFTKAIIKSGVIGFLLSSFLLSKLEKMKGKQ